MLFCAHNMKTVIATKIHYQHTELAYRHQARRDMQGWEALSGIWKDKKIENIVMWQKKIRKEWERQLPKLKK